MDTLERFDLDIATRMALSIASAAPGILVVGPPRSGKTTTAQWVAKQLGYRLRYAWAGETWPSFRAQITDIARDEVLHVDLDARRIAHEVTGALRDLVQSARCLVIATASSVDHIDRRLTDRLVGVDLETLPDPTEMRSAPHPADVRFRDQFRRMTLALDERTNLAVCRIRACLPSRN